MRANYRKFQGGWYWAAAGAAVGLAGYLTGARQQEKAAERQEASQREFAQQGIQWRVKDAEAAGVHPVYALGASTPSYTPVSGPSMTRGEAVSRSVQQGMQHYDVRRANERADKVADAAITKDYAMASMYANEAARIAQARNSGGGGYVAPADVVVGAYDDTPNRVESHPLYADAVKLEPDTMVSRADGLAGQTAGRNHPAFREFQMANGDSVLLPATGQGGIPEEIDMMLLPEIIGANINRYGLRQAWIGTLKRWFGSKLVDDELRSQSVTGKIRR